MEGLIPFVIHAIKKKKERSKYVYLSEGSAHALLGIEAAAGTQWPDREGSSRHRRTRSEFFPRREYDHPRGFQAPSAADHQQRPGLAPSRSLRDDALPSAAVNGGAWTVRTASFW